MKKWFGIMLLLSCMVIFSGIATALTGQEILEKMDQSFQAKSSKIEMNMVIYNEDGHERQRSLEILSKGDNVLLKFLTPSDVKGTALLLLQEKDETDMWLYLPALGSVRKVASHMQNGSFMGTDFTYQDFNMFGGEKYQENYQSTHVDSVVYDGVDCYLLETFPAAEDRSYSLIRIWVNKADFTAVKLEFFDQRGNPLKVMLNSQIKDIKGHLIPTRIEMQNLQRKSRTVLELVEVQYDQEIPDQVFTTRYLEKN